VLVKVIRAESTRVVEPPYITAASTLTAGLFATSKMVLAQLVPYSFQTATEQTPA